MNTQAIAVAGNANVLNASNANALFTEWLDFADVGQKSLETYNGALKTWFSFLNARGLSFENATRADVKSYLNDFCKGLAQSTKALRLQVVKTFYNFASEKMPSIKNPALRYKVKNSDSKVFKKDFLTKENTRAFLKKVKNPRDRAMLLLMVCTGIRVSEVVAADVNDLATLADGQVVLYVLGKGRAEKTEFVKLPPLVVEAIKSYLDTRKSGALFLGKGNRNQGERMATRTVGLICKTALRNIGLDSKRFTAHSLRHTAAVLNLQAGGTLPETMQMLRHKNIATTQIYTHAVERLQNQSEARVADFVFGKNENC